MKLIVPSKALVFCHHCKDINIFVYTNKRFRCMQCCRSIAAAELLSVYSAVDELDKDGNVELSLPKGCKLP